jgi:hypothetical protein
MTTHPPEEGVRGENARLIMRHDAKTHHLLPPRMGGKGEIGGRYNRYLPRNSPRLTYGTVTTYVIIMTKGEMGRLKKAFLIKCVMLVVYSIGVGRLTPHLPIIPIFPNLADSSPVPDVPDMPLGAYHPHSPYPSDSCTHVPQWEGSRVGHSAAAQPAQKLQPNQQRSPLR